MSGNRISHFGTRRRIQGPHRTAPDQTSSGVEVAADNSMPLTKIAAMKVENERKLSAVMFFLP